MDRIGHTPLTQPYLSYAQPLQATSSRAYNFNKTIKWEDLSAHSKDSINDMFKSSNPQAQTVAGHAFGLLNGWHLKIVKHHRPDRDSAKYGNRFTSIDQRTGTVALRAQPNVDLPAQLDIIEIGIKWDDPRSEADNSRFAIPTPQQKAASAESRIEPQQPPASGTTSAYLDSQGASSTRVPDPENPGQTVSRSTLRGRRHDRKQVPDPENPGQTISRHALRQRAQDRKQVPDPENPGQTISQSALKMRKQVPDPENPGQTVSKNALSRRPRHRQQVPDPQNPGQTISRGALKQRQKRLADRENA